MTENFHLTMAERVGAIDQKAIAAHSRIDSLEDDMKVTLKDFRDDIRTTLTEIRTELKAVNEHINVSKGKNAALMTILTLVSGTIGAFLVKYFLR